MADADPKLVEYLTSSLAQGRSKEDIYKELLTQGWTIEVIQASFNSLGDKKEKEDSSKKTTRIILTIGVILIGAGIFSFIASNWQGMSKFVKILLLIVSMLIVYSAAWYVKTKTELVKTGEALMLLGTLIYGGSIFLVAQMFNIQANWPDGFILWMLGALAMGIAMESYPLYYLAMIVGIVSLIGDPFYILDAFDYTNSFILTSTFLLIIATTATFITGWMIRTKMPPELKEYY